MTSALEEPQRRDLLGELTLVLGVVVGAAAVGRSHPPCRTRQPVNVLKKLSRLALAILIRPVPTSGGSLGRGFVGVEDRRAAEGADGAQAVRVAAGGVARPGVGEDADGVGERVAAAQRVAGRQRLPAPPEHDRVGVLRLVAVVDDEAVQVVGLLRRLHGGLVGGPDVGGRLAQPVTRRHDDLAEAAELEVLGDVDRLVQADEHPLVRLEIGRRGARQRHVDRSDRRLPVRTTRRRPLGVSWVWPWNSETGPVTCDDVAVGDEVGAVVEHEDAVGRGRVPSPASCR